MSEEDSKLHDLICYSKLVDECGWVNSEIFSVWVNYYYLDDFVIHLCEIYGNDILSTGYDKCVMMSNYIYIELNELVGDDVCLEELFPKDKFEH